MPNKLGRYLAIAEAISLLLQPHGEVVIHDLSNGCIAALFNNFSKRKVGDESLLEEVMDLKKIPDVFPPYVKTHFDGRRIKSVTATLRDNRGRPIGLLCINLDVSKWDQMQRLLIDWVQPLVAAEKPDLLFKDDWKEKINVYVSDYLQRHSVSFKGLTREQKADLVRALFADGAFQAKHAASYVADVLDLSRATIYNYLRRND